MQRSKKTVYVDLYGMSGAGETKADAKADAIMRLERATEGSYLPKVVQCAYGHYGILTRALDGWSYMLVDPGSVIDATGRVHTSSCGAYPTQDEAERHMRLHMAQNLIFVADDHGMSVLNHWTCSNADRQRHADELAWQQRAKRLRDVGYTLQDFDDMAVRQACDSDAATDAAIARKQATASVAD